MSGGHLSKDFFELIKAIGESKSKQEEDKIIQGEVQVLKRKLLEPNIPSKKMKEYMIRAVYVEMLGHDASFAYIHAVKLAQDKNVYSKKVGYMASSLFLNGDDELMLLLINTMQRDLGSSNFLETCAALSAVTQVVNAEMIPAILPLVTKLLTHSQDAVRKKAIICIQHFFRLSPDSVVDDVQQDVRRALCDPDPAVMGASLNLLRDIIRSDPDSCKDLVPSLVNILKQIIEHRLPRDFDYHRMPAPWLQVNLVNLMGMLGEGDQDVSAQVYDIIQETMRRADTGVNAGYSVVYECVKCAAKLYPSHTLLEQSAASISKFLQSDSHNLKYLGVTGLAMIIKVNPDYAREHQLKVVECLEDPDETLKRRTLDLLYRMANTANVIVVCAKMLQNLRCSHDVHLRRDLVRKVGSLADRYSPSNQWYAETINQVFKLAPSLVPPSMPNSLMRLVAESGEDDPEFRVWAVNTYVKMIADNSDSLPDVLVRIAAWVLGEYGCMCTLSGYTTDDIIDILVSQAVDRPTFTEARVTRGYLFSAMMKLLSQEQQQTASTPSVDTVRRALRKYSTDPDMYQRSLEYLKILDGSPDLLPSAFPYDETNYEQSDSLIDISLSFLDGVVDRAIMEGMKEYDRPSAMAYAVEASASSSSYEERHRALSGLNFTPYSAPTMPSQGAVSQPSSSTTNKPPVSSPYQSGSTQPPAPAGGLRVNAPKKWGPQGFNARKPAEAIASAAAPAAASSTFQQPSPAPPSRTPPALATVSTYPTPDELRRRAAQEKMAGALFAGIGTNDGSTNTATRRQPIAGPRSLVGQPGYSRPKAGSVADGKSAAPKAPPPPPTKAVDLLDLFGSPTAEESHRESAEEAVAMPVPLTTSSLDILSSNDDDMLGSAAPSSAPSLVPVHRSVQQPSKQEFNLLEQSPGSYGSIEAQQPQVEEEEEVKLRPLDITTEQLGGEWQKLQDSCEIQLSFSHVPEVSSRLTDDVGFHLVEVIGDERIFAATTPSGEMVFAHCRESALQSDLILVASSSAAGCLAQELIERATSE
ncbi:AP-1 complex subunit gamma-1, putative [Perkinsus marinus ATCC 50983]|uniref:AP-1 complex subunit gamma-1, putative n=1 Tax=Perkinsus marinus (strain ATCC 50983 / TXsc) TaxID=423536 RepID=C5LJH2_PERM5|nr:AP-1 complex subunit gamma-1, putative [Perkinsus marinus ATCC 50983]EER03101.1 AP-1 complex subunit gamma-1, putative [Perkinsus marinus ATCC 50983]|eukprot:XP_002771285.1 AP-1 complex subunit gamma-1, putative [Perkinsus marinus ATCC 50983]